MRRSLLHFYRLISCLLVICGTVNAHSVNAQSVVALRNIDGRHQLIRNGEPYFVNGAGGQTHLELLSRMGGNSIRTWGSDDIGSVLDEAHKHGLTVSVGFWLGHERHGFNYSDADQVRRQREDCLRVVREHKDHPAVLLWAVGNEMEGDGTNPLIWKAVQQIAAECKHIDPNHPTMTVIHESIDAKIPQIENLCPSIDIIGINTYGSVLTMPSRYRAAGGSKPYLLTEFSGRGHWESPTTPWGSPIEATSTAKADSYRAAYETAVKNQPGLCLGSYAFYWGNKQETTATWYGMLLPDGTRVASADAMSEAWTGKQPENRCPVIEPPQLSKTAGIKPGEVITASVSTSDPNNDPLNIQWVLRRDSKTIGTGGDFEPAEPDVKGAVVSDGANASVTVPEGLAAYRLFAYVYDGQGGAAVANVPLSVDVSPAAMEQARFPLTLFSDDHTDAFSPSGYMGNVESIKMQISTDNPHSGKACLQVDYDASDDWGGVIWQSPPNNWGDQPGRWNLTGATALEFWVRGEKGGEVISFAMGYLGNDKAYPDTGKAERADLTLTSKWQQVRIPLTGKNLQRIATGFGWSAASKGQPFRFYLDDIRYVK
ncbi:glycoside hydrolase family 2 TIM barrel-domain containing protein [Stieleria varia]|uniref:Glycoside hydrolase family 2 catalytic domain-containing protein n=1 Tax=Stieleria varia TaxID=2528005 RepID=A0A5C5ZZE6_9BACT|nr:glycoside hydrolase family 2 TIM barrel-domain containing protein [Stieleria varia]TWT92411.1 hypothetical protein Pla52n_62850 [Stieleria varia]